MLFIVLVLGTECCSQHFLFPPGLEDLNNNDGSPYRQEKWHIEYYNYYYRLYAILSPLVSAI